MASHDDGGADDEPACRATYIDIDIIIEINKRWRKN